MCIWNLDFVGLTKPFLQVELIKFMTTIDRLRQYLLEKYENVAENYLTTTDLLSNSATEDGYFRGVVAPQHKKHWKKKLVRDIIQARYPKAFSHGGFRTGYNPSSSSFETRCPLERLGKGSLRTT
jgi:hypothetical protein